MNGIVTANSKASARIQLAALRAAAFASKLTRNRGLQSAVWTLGRFFDSDNAADYMLGDKQLRIYLDDGYWMGPLLTGFNYEPELRVILDYLLKPDVAFVDCGANIGYWSLFALGKAGKIIAVEPTRRSFHRLEENNRLNGGQIVTVKAAISDSSDCQVTMITHARRHAGDSFVDNRLASSPDQYGSESVSTVTIDNLLTEHGLLGKDAVVKLDVEGAEVLGFRGAKRALEQGALFVYEEHGDNQDCAATDHLFGDSSMDVRVYNALDNGSLVPIETIDALRRLKTDASKGYNILAANRGSPLLGKAVSQFGVSSG